ncbi:hypothetical protein D477_016125 [Arthrobacter crystallopoietes BAB-32]|uniref:Uncharacterized protein n=1 Tax=Arthrobacter crystallopoietes BAB-32 TaxID=1246476 RepID=N1US04_9MICC|nr:hypothetical protein [Arthrobacter crystallopoietes]EMY33196.1 hypothetical protein D477_016125 [Arthrobacter crystallopoietes BAB-32]
MPFSALKPSDEFPPDLTVLTRIELEVLQARVNEELFRECNDHLAPDGETLFRFNTVAHELAIRRELRDLREL